MVTNDHEGYKKIQCWIPQEIWDKISLIYPNQTNAVTEAFNQLINKSQDNPNTSHNIPELKAQIEGLQLLLEEKNQRIEDLRKDKETLSIFAHYFKSLEYKRLEASTEEIKVEVQETEEKPASSPREAHIEKEKGTIQKICKYCNQPFETSNPKKETCSSKCRSAYSRKNKA